MSLWKILNSPLVLTVVSFLLGGILASAISAMWQRRSQKHSLRLMLAQEYLKSYHQYIRYLKRYEDFDPDEFDHLHTDILSKCGMVRVLYGEMVGIKVQQIANKMSTIHDLRDQAISTGREKLKRAYEKNLNEVFVEGRIAIEAIFRALD